MGQPAAVLGDRITAMCAVHVVPGPLGVPVPAPSLPFSAPMVNGLAMTVLVGGKPAAVVGSSGFNTPPHVGLHPADPGFGPPLQVGTVIAGSATVLFEGRPAARTGDPATVCTGLPTGAVVGTAVNVIIGG